MTVWASGAMVAQLSYTKTAIGSSPIWPTSVLLGHERDRMGGQ